MCVVVKHNYQLPISLQQYLGAFEYLRKAAIRFIISLRPHVTNRLSMDRISLNYVFVYFSKIYRANSAFIKN